MSLAGLIFRISRPQLHEAGRASFDAERNAALAELAAYDQELGV